MCEFVIKLITVTHLLLLLLAPLRISKNESLSLIYSISSLFLIALVTEIYTTEKNRQL